MEAKTRSKGKLVLLDLVYIAMFTALIAVCSQISIPLGPVPFTLQTLAIYIAAAMLGWKRGTISVLVYILIGLVGVPVFAGFSGGFSSVVTPSFGYIIGFVLTALVVGLSSKFFGNKLVPLIVSMVIGLLLCYIVGTIWFMVVYNVTNQYIDLGLALSWCVVPFIIPDMAKIAVAAILVNRLDKIVILIPDRK